MANLVCELEENFSSIVSSVASDLIYELIEKLGIDKDKVPIFYPGPNGKVTTWGSNNIGEVNPSDFSSQERLTIEYEEEFNEDDMLTLVSKRRQNPPIFEDNRFDVRIDPVYSRMKGTFSISYKARDRYQAESFVNRLRRKIAENRDVMTFSAKYTCPIPKTIVNAFRLYFESYKVNNLDFKNWEEYLKAYGIKEFTWLVNVAGEGDVLAFREIQENIYGALTDSSPPKPEKADETNRWNVSFSFEFFYDKIISMNFRYPIIVCNELIHEALYPEVIFDPGCLRFQAELTRAYYNKIQEAMYYYWSYEEAFIRIPYFDEWKDAQYRRGQVYLLSALIIVDKDDPREICNLMDLGEWGLSEIMSYPFKRQVKHLTRFREFGFYIGLYEEGYQLRDDNLIIDRELNVRSRFDLSFYKNQRLVIKVMTDLSMLSKQGLTRFFNEPIAVNAWLDIMIGHRPINGYPNLSQPDIITNDITTPIQIAQMDNLKVDIKDFLRVCKENGIKCGLYQDKQGEVILNPGSIMKTVGIFTMTTDKKGEENGYR